MGSIYARAVCTIASTGSDSGYGGCFHERNCLNLQPCKIGVRYHGPNCTAAIYVRRDDVSDFQRNVDNGLSISEAESFKNAFYRLASCTLVVNCYIGSAASGRPQNLIQMDIYTKHFPKVSVTIILWMMKGDSTGEAMQRDPLPTKIPVRYHR